MYDLVIQNGSIIDGTASPAYRADVAIKNGKITTLPEMIRKMRCLTENGWER